MTESMTEAPGQRDIVLVVDDSPETLGFLTKALEASGVTVLVATSGTAALTIAGRITPDMVLMDAVMPQPDGFETCRQLKAMPELAHVPVIFMTGLSETEHVVHALESGGVDFLTKPINLDELQARIRVHLANARQVQSARIALDAAGRHLMAVTSTGSVKWATPQARTALSHFAGRVGSDVLPLISQHLGAWLGSPSQMAGQVGGSRTTSFIGAPGQKLDFTYLGAVGPDEYLFRLTGGDEAGQTDGLRTRFGLTAREAEVLLWIARGKANKDIGEILGLSPRTVNKHLEQIYVKLGVENRASAAVKTAEAMSEL